jgi:hypothetical protein
MLQLIIKKEVLPVEETMWKEIFVFFGGDKVYLVDL